MALKNQKGQVIVESMLIMVVLIGTMYLVVGQLKKMDFIKKIAVDPWAKVSGMVECGAWSAKCGINANGSEKFHPNNRIVSYRPD